MTGNEIRTRFLEHFQSREHKVLESAPLVPRGDPSTLFISAGMQPLQPYYLGLSDPPAPRLATVQKCFRAVDIDEVGDRTHTTMFEMMGNFAPTGAYFKETAIPLAWELIHETFKLPVNRLRITVHPQDDESYMLWTETIGIPADRMHKMESNWWGLGRGPCGYDSEIFYDLGREVGCGLPDCWPDHCDRYLEIWNLVFPQYDQQEDGSLVPLPKPAVDTGSGLERTAVALQGVQDVFSTDLYLPIITFVRESSSRRDERSERIVTDHLRAMTFLIGDGVVPSNEGRGYVLRRVIRRALIHARRIDMKRALSHGVVIVTDLLSEPYPELTHRAGQIGVAVQAEAMRFQKTLDQGLEQFEKVVARAKRIAGEDAFRLHDTFGFPLELTRELAAERGIEVDEEGFHAGMSAQRERSRSGFKPSAVDFKDLPRGTTFHYDLNELDTQVIGIRRDGQNVQHAFEGDEVEVYLRDTPFYPESGGQIGDTGEIRTQPSGGIVLVEDTQKITDGVIAHIGRITRGEIDVQDNARARIDAARRHAIARHHSATHLLHKALRETLGEAVVQKGSWVGPDHTTFDIPLNRAMTRDELARVNARVMEKVREALPFHESHKPYKEAVAQGAMHLFEEKYGDVVRIVCFGDWTCELCGGTHVKNSADVGTAVIVSESSIGSGLRRIDLVVGEPADELVRRDRELLQDLARSFNAVPEQLPERIATLRAELKAAERERQKLRDELRSSRVKGGNGLHVKHGRVDYLTETVDAATVDELKAYADRYLELLKSGIVTVVAGDKFVIKVSNDLTPEFDANTLKAYFGRGGGRPQLVSGVLNVPVEEAFKRLEEALGGGAG